MVNATVLNGMGLTGEAPEQDRINDCIKKVRVWATPWLLPSSALLECALDLGGLYSILTTHHNHGMTWSMRAGRFEEEPSFTPSNAGGRLLSVIFEHSEVRPGQWVQTCMGVGHWWSHAPARQDMHVEGTRPRIC